MSDEDEELDGCDLDFAAEPTPDEDLPPVEDEK